MHRGAEVGKSVDREETWTERQFGKKVDRADTEGQRMDRE